MRKTKRYKNIVRQQRCADQINELADQFCEMQDSFVSLLDINDDKFKMAFQANNLITFIASVFKFPKKSSLENYEQSIKLLRKKLIALTYCPLQLRHIEEDDDDEEI